MKKKGTTFIEIVVAIAIFLIGILPVAYLTLNSLKSLKKSMEIQERVKVTTTVINYIKSRGYSSLLEDVLGDADEFSATYYIKKDSVEEAYVIDNSGVKEDFEEDFLEIHFMMIQIAMQMLCLLLTVWELIFRGNNRGGYEKE